MIEEQKYNKESLESHMDTLFQDAENRIQEIRSEIKHNIISFFAPWNKLLTKLLKILKSAENLETFPTSLLKKALEEAVVDTKKTNQFPNLIENLNAFIQALKENKDLAIKKSNIFKWLSLAHNHIAQFCEIYDKTRGYQEQNALSIFSNFDKALDYAKASGEHSNELIFEIQKNISGSTASVITSIVSLESQNDVTLEETQTSIHEKCSGFATRFKATIDSLLAPKNQTSIDLFQKNLKDLIHDVLETCSAWLDLEDDFQNQYTLLSLGKLSSNEFLPQDNMQFALIVPHPDILDTKINTLFTLFEICLLSLGLGSTFPSFKYNDQEEEFKLWGTIKDVIENSLSFWGYTGKESMDYYLPNEFYFFSGNESLYQAFKQSLEYELTWREDLNQLKFNIPENIPNCQAFAKFNLAFDAYIFKKLLQGEFNDLIFNYTFLEAIQTIREGTYRMVMHTAIFHSVFVDSNHVENIVNKLIKKNVWSPSWGKLVINALNYLNSACIKAQQQEPEIQNQTLNQAFESEDLNISEYHIRGIWLTVLPLLWDEKLQLEITSRSSNLLDSSPETSTLEFIFGDSSLLTETQLLRLLISEENITKFVHFFTQLKTNDQCLFLQKGKAYCNHFPNSEKNSLLFNYLSLRHKIDSLNLETFPSLSQENHGWHKEFENLLLKYERYNPNDLPLVSSSHPALPNINIGRLPEAKERIRDFTLTAIQDETSAENYLKIVYLKETMISFFKLFISSDPSSPNPFLIVVTTFEANDEQQETPYLVHAGETQREALTPENLAFLDKTNFTEWLFLSLLLNSNPYRWENVDFELHPYDKSFYPDVYYQLFSLSFPNIGLNKILKNPNALSAQNVIYCLKHMQETLCPAAIYGLLSLNPNSLFTHWESWLKQLKSAYYPDGAISAETVLSNEQIHIFYSRLTNLQSILSETSPSITGLDLLMTMDPDIGKTYKKAFEIYPNQFKKRAKAIFTQKSDYEKSLCKGEIAFVEGITNASPIIDSLLSEQRNYRAFCREDLNSFNELPTEKQNRLLANLDWLDISEEYAGKILNTLLRSRSKWEAISFKNCSILSDSDLIKFVERNPQLTYLNLIDCKNLTIEKTFSTLKFLENLEVLNTSLFPKALPRTPSKLNRATRRLSMTFESLPISPRKRPSVEEGEDSLTIELPPMLHTLAIIGGSTAHAELNILSGRLSYLVIKSCEGLEKCTTTSREIDYIKITSCPNLKHQTIYERYPFLLKHASYFFDLGSKYIDELINPITEIKLDHFDPEVIETLEDYLKTEKRLHKERIKHLNNIKTNPRAIDAWIYFNNRLDEPTIQKIFKDFLNGELPKNSYKIIHSLIPSLTPEQQDKMQAALRKPNLSTEKKVELALCLDGYKDQDEYNHVLASKTLLKLLRNAPTRDSVFSAFITICEPNDYIIISSTLDTLTPNKTFVDYSFVFSLLDVLKTALLRFEHANSFEIFQILTPIESNFLDFSNYELLRFTIKLEAIFCALKQPVNDEMMLNLLTNFQIPEIPFSVKLQISDLFIQRYQFLNSHDYELAENFRNIFSNVLLEMYESEGLGKEEKILISAALVQIEHLELPNVAAIALSFSNALNIHELSGLKDRELDPFKLSIIKAFITLGKREEIAKETIPSIKNIATNKTNSLTLRKEGLRGLLELNDPETLEIEKVLQGLYSQNDKQMEAAETKLFELEKFESETKRTLIILMLLSDGDLQPYINCMSKLNKKDTASSIKRDLKRLEDKDKRLALSLVEQIQFAILLIKKDKIKSEENLNKLSALKISKTSSSSDNHGFFGETLESSELDPSSKESSSGSYTSSLYSYNFGSTYTTSTSEESDEQDTTSSSYTTSTSETTSSEEKNPKNGNNPFDTSTSYSSSSSSS